MVTLKSDGAVMLSVGGKQILQAMHPIASEPTQQAAQCDGNQEMAIVLR